MRSRRPSSRSACSGPQDGGTALLATWSRRPVAHTLDTTFGTTHVQEIGGGTGTPIVPVAIVGGEETNPMLFRIEYLTKALGLRLEYARFGRFAGESVNGLLPESDQVQFGMQFRF